MEATWTTAWETILNAGKSDDTNRDCHGVGEQQVESGPAPEDGDDSIATALQEVIPDEVKSQVKNAMVEVLVMVEGAVEHLFQASTPSAQGGICTMMYGALENVILHKIRMAGIGGKIYKHVDKYFEASKATKELGKGFLRNEEFLAPKESFVQTRAVEAIADQCWVNVFRNTSMTTSANMDAAVAAVAYLVEREHRLIRAPRALVRSAVKVVSHGEPTTILAVASVKEEATKRACRTQQCRRVTSTTAGRPDATVV